jgi:hypothetical protein
MTPEEIQAIHDHYIKQHFQAIEHFQQSYEEALKEGDSFADTVRDAREALDQSKAMQATYDIIEQLMAIK